MLFCVSSECQILDYVLIVGAIIQTTELMWEHPWLDLQSLYNKHGYARNNFGL
jgi:hypothetical protein